MRIEKVVDLGSMSVRVRELTVGDLRNLLKRDALEIDVTAFLKDGGGLPSEVIEAFTDLDHDKIEAMSFSEVMAVIDAVKEVNSYFFGVIEALGELTGLASGMVGASLPSSNMPFSGSKEPATMVSPTGD